MKAQVRKLVGKKIFLGPVSLEKIPELVRWANDLDVTKYLTIADKNNTEETTRAYLEKMLHDQNACYFGIYTKKGKLIGGTDLKDIDPVNRTANIGIMIGDKVEWNKGYGTEAIQLLIDYGFSVLNLNNIMLVAYEYNDRAQRCYEKAGFRVIGRRRKARYYAGRYYDEVFMDILASEFKGSGIRTDED
jgi:RimJ/RimL family protein N-acetyltransferase